MYFKGENSQQIIEIGKTIPLENNPFKCSFRDMYHTKCEAAVKTNIMPSIQKSK